jgi:DNA-binding MarR family transcriptional regulator
VSAARDAGGAAIDLESRAHADHHEALRLWLRLLTCTQLIEAQVRSGLRSRFATTLPRFDLMAQLERSRDGMKMGELSRRMMVTGGNVTGITDQLEAEGLVERCHVPGDRRAALVRLTAKGRLAFDRMADAHEEWIVAMLSGLRAVERRQLHALLGKIKEGVAVQRAAPASKPVRLVKAQTRRRSAV